MRILIATADALWRFWGWICYNDPIFSFYSHFFLYIYTARQIYLRAVDAKLVETLDIRGRREEGERKKRAEVRVSSDVNVWRVNWCNWKIALLVERICFKTRVIFSESTGNWTIRAFYKSIYYRTPSRV